MLNRPETFRMYGLSGSRDAPFVHDGHRMRTLYMKQLLRKQMREQRRKSLRFRLTLNRDKSNNPQRYIVPLYTWEGIK